MALNVEDGTGVANADAFVAVADVDTYWANRNDTVWSALTTPAKEGAIRIATQYIDKVYDFIGYRKVAYQTLQWPRFMNLVGAHHMLDPQLLLPGILTVPNVLKEATCELAMEAINGALAPSYDRSGRIASESVGALSTSYFPDAPTVPRYPMIDILLTDITNGKKFGGVTMTAVRG